MAPSEVGATRVFMKRKQPTVSSVDALTVLDFAVNQVAIGRVKLGFDSFLR
jgi:hypothetical protein